jgi:hypothetical protein
VPPLKHGIQSFLPNPRGKRRDKCTTDLARIMQVSAPSRKRYVNNVLLRPSDLNSLETHLTFPQVPNGASSLNRILDNALKLRGYPPSGIQSSIVATATCQRNYNSSVTMSTSSRWLSATKTSTNCDALLWYLSQRLQQVR